MQKCQGNGVQSKPAVRPHKSSCPETKAGADSGGPEAAERADTTVNRAVRRANYRMMKLELQTRFRRESSLPQDSTSRLTCSAASQLPARRLVFHLPSEVAETGSEGSPHASKQIASDAR